MIVAAWVLADARAKGDIFFSVVNSGLLTCPSKRVPLTRMKEETYPCASAIPFPWPTVYA